MKADAIPWGFIVPALFLTVVVLMLGLTWVPEDTALVVSRDHARRLATPNPLLCPFMFVGTILSAGIAAVVMRTLASGDDDEPIDYDRL